MEKQMPKVTIKNSVKNKFLHGYPLIRKEEVLDVQVTNDWVDFVDEKDRFIAKGYLGEQNKGIGWILSLKNVPIDHHFFMQKFEQAKQERSTYFYSQDTDTFRIFNGEGDGIGGMTVDYYNGYAVVSWYNATIYHHRQLIMDSFLKVYPEIIGIYEKNRFKSDLPESNHFYGRKAPEPLIVKENNVQFATYLNEGWMTGIFLDQHEVRGRLVDGLAMGKRVLNMFSYTGAFSVAAAFGGASSTTSVDLAKRSLEKTKEQFAVNGFTLENHKIHVMDTFDYFRYAKKKGLQFDVIVLDPPSFARNGKKVFSVAKNYGDLIADSLPILADQGIIIASTNASNVPLAKFQKMIEKSFQSGQVKCHLLESHHLPADFKTNSHYEESDYLKVLIYQKVSK